MLRGTSLAAGVVACGAVVVAPVPAAHAAAAKPDVTTGPVANVSPTSATLIGAVRPNEAATAYFFQYGPTKRYGTNTARLSAGSGKGRVAAAVDIAALTPNTVYHYRLVARNRRGTVRAKDRTFRTAPQPLGFSLAATPNPVTFGGTTIVSGALAGTGTKGSQVVLQGNPFPYVQGFVTVGNPQVVNETGAFSFPVLGLSANTQYRVRIPNREVISPVLTAAVAPRITTRLDRTRVRRGRTVRISGAVRPARQGLRVAIQKQNSRGNWSTVGGTITRGGTANFTVFAKRIRIRRGGQYRVFVQIADGSLVSQAGTPVRVTSFRR